MQWWFLSLVQTAASCPLHPLLNYDPPPVVDAVWRPTARLQHLENCGCLEGSGSLLPRIWHWLFVYRALRWQSAASGHSPPRSSPTATQLIGESQQDALLKNTEFLLAGYPALHVLFPRQSRLGKSLVKGLLHEHSDRNLVLIEVAKSDLKDLPAIVEQLRGVPQKYLRRWSSFEEDDDAFKALKVVLRGI